MSGARAADQQYRPALVVGRLVIAACVLVVSACGVSSQDEPQLIEESTQAPSTATPSFATETSPPSSTQDTSPEPTPSTPSTTAPPSSPPG